MLNLPPGTAPASTPVIEPDLFTIAQSRANSAEGVLDELRNHPPNLLREAQAFTRLMKDFHWRQEDIAQALGRSRASIANRVRLLELAPTVQQHLTAGRITVGHAKVLLGVKDLTIQSDMAETVATQTLTVRALEKLVQVYLRRLRLGDTAAPTSGEIAQQAEQTLLDHLNTPVRVIDEGACGRIEIEYQGIDDLQRLMNLLGLTT